ncbi:MAG: M81 family metallopeptidase [Firmicutes bacterium]|nr:M81 family metallopeptidase [Bacillota bacterium]
MKILFGMLAHETNTFAADKGTFERWAPSGWTVGEDIMRVYDGAPDYPGGMIRAAREEGVELIPTVALLNAGPLLTEDAIEYALGTLLGYVKKYKDEIDGICLGLHGAGAAEVTDDLETYTLQKVREIVGSDMPITVSLDLHGNISDDMIRLSDGLFGIKQYPHVDQAEAGYLAMKTLIRMLSGESSPKTVLRQLPLLIAPSVGSTYNMPMRAFTEHFAAFAEAKGLIDATFFHGFPYTDVHYAGASVVVVAEEGAEEAADQLALWVWENRRLLDPVCLSCEEAVDQALAELDKDGTGYVVINETSDNPGGGTPGDGTHLLREFLRRNLKGSIMGYIADSEIALKAHEAGIGGHISGLLGGKTDNQHGEPVEFENAQVMALSDGHAIYTSPMYEGLPVCYGKTARLRIGNVEVVVSETLSQQTFDDRPFAITGADLEKYRIVGLKSSVHFRAFFQPRAKAIVTADPPGIQTANFHQLSYKKIRRPVYPLDPETTFGGVNHG